MHFTNVDLTTGEVSQVEMTAEEIAAAEQRSATEQILIADAKARADLLELEQAQIRPMAECLVALIAGEPLPLYAKAKLADIELQKADRRKGLQK